MTADPGLRAPDHPGLAPRPLDHRPFARRLVGSLRGRVLEIGVGAAANLGWLHPSVDWVGIEPSRRRRRRLGDPRVLPGVAEDLPFAGRSVDAVLATKVLCSVDEPAQALTEVCRVLRPGGRFVFVEHVAAPTGTWTRRFQHAIAPASRLLDAGCDPSRETWRTLSAAPFASLTLEWFGRSGWPVIVGEARTPVG